MSRESIYPEIVYSLLNTHNLWYPGRLNSRFVESIVVKRMFVHRYTLEPLNPNDRADIDRFSVFFATARTRLAWKHIAPLNARPKTRNQLWDDKYVDGLFWDWLSCIESSNPRKNKIAYVVDERLTLDDLYRFKNEAKSVR